MRLKLKEDPREWQKHLLVMVIIVEVICVVCFLRGKVSATSFRAAQWVLAFMLGALLAKPRWFRQTYRVWATANYFIGKMVGRVVLTLFYFIILTPLGLMLRLAGRDLLKLRRLPPGESYWQKCPPSSNFDRMF
jgi:hypothetical protein